MENPDWAIQFYIPKRSVLPHIGEAPSVSGNLPDQTKARTQVGARTAESSTETSPGRLACGESGTSQNAPRRAPTRHRSQSEGNVTSTKRIPPKLKFGVLHLTEFADEDRVCRNMEYFFISFKNPLNLVMWKLGAWRVNFCLYYLRGYAIKNDASAGIQNDIR